jgi:hypothetical protein
MVRELAFNARRLRGVQQGLISGIISGPIVKWALPDAPEARVRKETPSLRQTHQIVCALLEALTELRVITLACWKSLGDCKDAFFPCVLSDEENLKGATTLKGSLKPSGRRAASTAPALTETPLQGKTETIWPVPTPECGREDAAESACMKQREARGSADAEQSLRAAEINSIARSGANQQQEAAAHVARETIVALERAVWRNEERTMLQVPDNQGGPVHLGAAHGSPTPTKKRAKRKVKCHAWQCDQRETHYTADCPVLMRLPLAQRKAVIRDNNLCEYSARHRKGSVCYNLVSLKELRCSAPGCGENHPGILYPDPVIVHHLGTRWANQKLTSPAGEAWADQKMSCDGRSLGEIILEPEGAEPVSEDEFDFGPDGGEEVNETAPQSDSRGSESPKEEEKSGSDAGEPEDESSEEDSHSESENENENNHRKMLLLSQTVTVFDKKVNICFDSGSTISVINNSADVPYIFKKVEEVGIAPVEGGLCIETLPQVTIPLLM